MQKKYELYQNPFILSGEHQPKPESTIIQGLHAGIEVLEYIDQLLPKIKEVYRAIYQAYLALHHYHYEIYVGYETILISYLRNIITWNELIEINERVFQDRYQVHEILHKIAIKLDPNMKPPI